MAQRESKYFSLALCLKAPLGVGVYYELFISN